MAISAGALPHYSNCTALYSTLPYSADGLIIFTLSSFSKNKKKKILLFYHIAYLFIETVSCTVSKQLFLRQKKSKKNLKKSYYESVTHRTDSNTKTGRNHRLH